MYRRYNRNVQDPGLDSRSITSRGTTSVLDSGSSTSNVLESRSITSSGTTNVLESGSNTFSGTTNVLESGSITSSGTSNLNVNDFLDIANTCWRGQISTAQEIISGNIDYINMVRNYILSMYLNTGYSIKMLILPNVSDFTVTNVNRSTIGYVLRTYQDFKIIFKGFSERDINTISDPLYSAIDRYYEIKRGIYLIEEADSNLRTFIPGYFSDLQPFITTNVAEAINLLCIINC